MPTQEMVRPDSRAAWPGPLGRRLHDAAVRIDLSTATATKTERRGVYEASGDGVRHSVRFQRSRAQSSKNYVLRMRTAASVPPINARINQQSIEGQGVLGREGWYYLISSESVRGGENVLQFETPDTAKKGLWLAAVEMLPLDNEAYVAHFEDVFGVKRTLAQPPADLHQLKYDVLHYDLDITLDMHQPTIPSATLTMTAMSLDSSLDVIPLDFDGNDGTMVVTKVDGGPASQSFDYVQDAEQTRLSILLPKPVPAGQEITVRVSYGGTPRQGIDHFIGKTFAAYATDTHGPDNAPIVYTKSQPYFARTWWPCKDIPEDKATADVRITCPTSYTAISNGELLSTVDRGDGTHTYHWRESYPIATYLISVTCSNFLEARADYTALDGRMTMPVSHYVYPENLDFEGSSAVDGTVSVIRFFAETFGEYPFLREKYSNVTFPRLGGMEHQTCTSIGARGAGQDGLTFLNVHELSHQWFGDKVTMAHYDHLWLNEGFAMYCWPLFVEHLQGVDAYHEEMNVMNPSDSPLIGPDADQLVWDVVFEKGAWVLHMLRRIVGDEAFFLAVRNYLDDPALAYGTVLSSDLQAHFEAVYGEPLSWFFDEWLYYASRPTYNWAWRTWREGGEQILGLWADQSQTLNGDVYAMPIDLVIAGPDNEFELRRVFIDEQTQTFKINLGALDPREVTWDPDNWVLCTANEQASFPSRALWLSAYSLDFGDIPPGSASTQPLTIENIGTEALHIEELRTIGVHAGAFEIIAPGTPIEVEPGIANSVNVSVRFAPDGDGTYDSATLEIVTREAGSASVRLQGTGKDIPADVSEWFFHEEGVAPLK